MGDSEQGLKRSDLQFWRSLWLPHRESAPESKSGSWGPTSFSVWVRDDGGCRDDKWVDSECGLEVADVGEEIMEVLRGEAGLGTVGDGVIIKSDTVEMPIRWPGGEVRGNELPSWARDSSWGR